MENIKENLEKQANSAYYTGTEKVLEDHEFDLLSQNGLKQDSRSFRNKVEHRIAMGSLQKKTSAPDLSRWWTNNGYRHLIVMPKADGCSLSLSYRDGSFERSVSRGDGRVGSDISANILATNAPKTLIGPALPAQLEARAEAIIPTLYESQYESNLRNVCSGRIMAKDVDPGLSHIDTIIFDLFDPQSDIQPSWEQKRAWLDALPASCRIDWIEMEPDDAENLYTEMENIYTLWLDTLDYAIDGLVLLGLNSLTDPMPEPSLDPREKIACKFKNDGVPAMIGGVEWNLGQHAKLSPVLLLDPPARIDGTNVSRVSASNYSLLKAGGLGIGAQVEVCKSGDIIPIVNSIIEPSDRGLELPACPSCGTQSELDERQIDAVCVNDLCSGKGLVVLQRLIGLFEIDFVSDSTIEKLWDAGFSSLERLFAATVDEIAALSGFGDKTARHIVESLANIEITEPVLFKAVGLKGMGSRKGEALLTHYGSIDSMIEQVNAKGMDKIEGFGDIQSKQIEDNLHLIEQTKERFEGLGIKITPFIQPQASASDVEPILICATGKAPMPRKDFEAHVAQFNYVLQDRVTADTAMVVCADTAGSSSKLKKAKAQGIEVVSYQDFLSRIETSEAEETASPVTDTTHSPVEADTLPVPDETPGDNEIGDSLFAAW